MFAIATMAIPGAFLLAVMQGASSAAGKESLAIITQIVSLHFKSLGWGSWIWKILNLMR